MMANQLRVLMTSVAYVLQQELRIHARHTKFARAQVSTLRPGLLKIGGRVKTSIRRITYHLPCTSP